nr:beta-1,3-galactosyltransferase 1 [Ciona intestinalis]|eukprot:XP_002128865.1 beta-1,3-galactosyltransferase 1 [Ciona intestinalis]
MDLTYIRRGFFVLILTTACGITLRTDWIYNTPLETLSAEKLPDTLRSYNVFDSSSSFKEQCAEIIQKLPSPKTYDRKDGFQRLPERYLRNRNRMDEGYKCGKVLRPKIDKETPWMTLLVKTAPKNFEYRNIIRKTWGGIQQFRGKIFKAIFMVGLAPSDDGVQTNLTVENGKYGDVLQCDFVDAYNALPTKVLSSLRWIVEENATSRFYSVTDDDCVINIPLLHDIFTKKDKGSVKDSLDDHNTVYCGYKYEAGAKPYRNNSSKWQMSMDLYSASNFPTYCMGAMWTLSFEIIRSLTCLSTVTDYADFYVEDVLITGILREKLGQGESNIKRIWKSHKVEKLRLLTLHTGKMEKKEGKKAMFEQWETWSKNLTTVK